MSYRPVADSRYCPAKPIADVASDPVAVPTGMPYVAGYSYAFNNPLTGTDASGNWTSNCGVFSQACDSYTFFATKSSGLPRLWSALLRRSCTRSTPITG